MKQTDGLIRRIAVALLSPIAYWMVAAGLLALAVRRGLTTMPWADVGGSAGTVERVGLIELYAAILTFDFGRSESTEMLTTDVVAGALGKTLVLLAVTAVFVVLFGVVLLVVRRRLSAAGADRIAELPAALAGAAPPVALLTTLILVTLEWEVPYPVVWQEGVGLVGYVLPAVPLALPGAAVLGRRDWTAGSVAELRRGLTEASAYVVYLFSGVITLEALFMIPGVGQHFFLGVTYWDAGLVVGTTAVAIVGLLFVGFLRDLAELAGEMTLSPDSESAPTTDGGVRRSSGAHPTALGLARAEPLVLLGGVGLALCLLAGLGGAATTGVRLGSRAGVQPVARFVAGLASLSLVASVAAATASLVGIGAGLVGGTVGGTVRGALRRVLDFGGVLPVLPVALIWMYAGVAAASGSPLSVELSIGLVGGVVLSPVVYRGTTAALARADGGLEGAVLTGLGDAATYAPFVGFVVVEFTVLGIHDASAPVVLPALGAQSPQLSTAIVGLVAYGLPAFALLVLGAGLRRAGDPA